MIVLKNSGDVIIAETELFLVHKRSNDSHLADQCISTITHTCTYMYYLRSCITYVRT